ncbi:MAG: hypothetical protein A4E72_00986 [Syntrophus sp. PtaU1.Bin208]|nr:MAG: hypothetical protein A4E72_00986 [Syntrophus sp. PtaU1.Bin208]
MGRSHRFHFSLNLLLIEPDVIKDSLAAAAGIDLPSGAQKLRKVEDRGFEGQLQSQVVKPRCIQRRNRPPGIQGLRNGRNGKEHQRTEVEGVSDASQLIIEEGVIRKQPIGPAIPEIGINQTSPGQFGNLQQALQRR